MDEVFGEDNFVNEIVWSYRSGGASRKESLPKKHDTILFYRKNNTFELLLLNTQRTKHPPYLATLKRINRITV